MFVDKIPGRGGKSDIKLFAGDIKIWRVIKQDTDTQRLQKDLDRLIDWSRNWLLTFNAPKCNTMHKGKHNPKAYSMKLGNGRTELERTTKEKDLGVLELDNLKP